MHLAQQLNLPSDYSQLLESAARDYEESLLRIGVGDCERGWHDAWHSWGIAQLSAKSSFVLGRWEECRDWCKKAAITSIFCLLGDWREKTPTEDGQIGRRAWFARFPADNWTMVLGDGLNWAAVGGHWDSVDELLLFPQPWVAEDYEGKAARSYYLGLARWWKDKQDLVWIDEVKQLRGAGSKGVHLLCDAVAAISQRDAEATASTLKKYVEWFLKRRDHEEQFPVSATFLWHVARRSGLEIELPEEIDIYLFRLPDDV